jgi:hypothetical protein
MFADHQILALKDLLIFSSPSIAISLLYFVLNKNIGFLQKIGVSLHGILFSLQGLLAVFISPYTGQTGAPYSLLTALITIPFLLGVGSVIFSFKHYKGKEVIHALQVINLGSAILVWFVAGMIIRHDGF